jgi:hypothetical protein
MASSAEGGLGAAAHAPAKASNAAILRKRLKIME